MTACLAGRSAPTSEAEIAELGAGRVWYEPGDTSQLGGGLPDNPDGCSEALSLDLNANGKIEDNWTCWHDLPEAEDRAMAIEETRGMIEREPFQPYFIKAKGGREHAIGHRANASISEACPSTVAIFVRGRRARRWASIRSRPSGSSPRWGPRGVTHSAPCGRAGIRPSPPACRIRPDRVRRA